jgi:hypothetical protein
MAEDIEVAVVGQDLETMVANSIPLVQDFSDFEDLSPRLVYIRESERPFIGLEA